ncbi:MAG: ANTAR domain-containing protein [Betaproteobacteria bacterium]|nr:ANTAR domain-containing protein [Betaproteobacteria bacterium]
MQCLVKPCHPSRIHRPAVHDPSGLQFLIASRQGEIAELGDLTRTVDLVQSISALVHQLQRERGLSNLFIASGGQRFATERTAQLGITDAAQAQADAQLQRLDPTLAAAPPAGQGSRLYARIAQALQAQAALPALRAAVQMQAMTAARATHAYVRVVGAWLGVVFEAADIAADAEVSQRLVSLFNLMQAKEQAGQERALGAALFAAGTVHTDDRMRLQDLIEAQQRSLAVFEQFAADAALHAWQAVQAQPGTRDRLRLRRLLLEPAAHGALNPAMSMPWFEACSATMDGLKAVEDALLVHLRSTCVVKCAALEHEVSALFRLSQAAAQPGGLLSAAQALALLESGDRHGSTAPQAMFGTDAAHPTALALPAQIAPQVASLVASQAQRLGVVTAELDAARAALQDRKLIERAKGLLMQQAALSEDDAYQALRRMAMRQGRRVGEVAADLLHRTDQVPD